MTVRAIAVVAAGFGLLLVAAACGGGEPTATPVPAEPAVPDSPRIVALKAASEAKGLRFLTHDEIVAGARREGALVAVPGFDDITFPELKKAFEAQYPFIELRIEIAQADDVGRVEVDPSHFGALRNPIAAHVVNLFEVRARLLHRLALCGFKRGFSRLDSTARYAPPSVFDVTDEHLVSAPREHERRKRSQRSAKRRGAELQRLSTVLAAGVFLHPFVSLLLPLRPCKAAVHDHDLAHNGLDGELPVRSAV